MRKKIWTKAAAILTAALVLTGCGGSPASTTAAANATDAPAGTTAAPQTETGKPSSGTTELNMWSVWTGSGGEAIQKMADEFNASQSEYKVNVTYSGSYAETLAKFQASSAGSRPDMVMVSTESAALFFDNPDYYTPIAKYAEEDSYDMSGIFNNLKASYTDTEGNWQCLPLGNTVVGFFYNNEVLQKAGVDPASLNSYEEIEAACQKLADAGVQYPFVLVQNSIYYTFPLTAEGIDYVDNNNGKDGCPTKCLLDEEPAATATAKYFQFIKNLSSKNQLAPYDLDAADTRQMFVNGDAAIMMATCSGLNAIGELAQWNLDFGFHVAPTISKGVENKGQCTGGGVLFIANNGDENKDRGSWEFMKTMMEPENTAAFAMATGYLPINQQGADTAEYQKFVEEKFPTAKDAMAAQMATGEDVYNAILPMFSDFHQIVMDYMAKVVNEPEYTADQATADMAADINECIELYNLSK
ncbi:extracellular solute-binding protein [Cuneatibacter sp. NSJ-177]|uniref:extracellular solute-binding protein n=1 Tax=Cuneatibacter sp. NSJ-177 TaxID=2931401 RepID=UPI001FD2FCCB|nr:extracellular solute-binding protein [Cuneatibacter sp. NSJ-177]MCJ7834361.1 extracellular solute-binding protein [Cuneatibacter sp. NSJ-177]